jgi:hypothetical protein
MQILTCTYVHPEEEYRYLKGLVLIETLPLYYIYLEAEYLDNSSIVEEEGAYKRAHYL